MKFKTVSLILIAAFVLTNVGCSKYEYGPGISLKTKKSRVANEWQIQYAEDLAEGVEITEDYAGEVWEFTKEGEYKENGEIKGTWSFSEDKEELIIVFNDGDSDTYRILKLKDEEMWLEVLAEEELHLTSY